MLNYVDICNKEYIKIEADLALKSSNSKPSKEKDHFSKNFNKYIDEIYTSLINETYEFSDLRSMKVYEPKERKIDIPPFYPDRIYQRLMMDSIKDKFIEIFIDNTFSSIKGRGLMNCKDTIESIIKKYPGWYYINIDVKKYFESIDHEILKNKIRDLGIDEKILKMHFKSIDKHKKGIAIGCYPSQYYANLYLTDFDYLMMWYTSGKYIRYMDNCIIWVETKAEAHKLLQYIREYFNRYLKLTIKNNWQIAQVEKSPLRFCGYVYYSNRVLIKKNIKMSAKRKAKKLEKLGVDDNTWKMQMSAYYGWFKSCSGANLWKILKNGRIIIMKKETTNRHKNIKTLKELKSIGEFGLSKDKRVSIEKLIGKEIIVTDAQLTTKYDNREKLIVCFQELVQRIETEDGDTEIIGKESQYFITGSGVLKDRILKMAENYPFIGTILKLPSKRGMSGSFYTIQ